MRIRRALAALLRAAAIAALVAVIPALAAGSVAHLMLDDSQWTDPKTAPSSRPAPAPTAEPASKRPETAGPNGLIGRCAIPTRTAAVLTPCTTPGALTIVGTVRRDAANPRRPCKTTPFTDTVRPHGTYFLCLGTP